jgi:hypothetical protein
MDARVKSPLLASVPLGEVVSKASLEKDSAADKAAWVLDRAVNKSLDQPAAKADPGPNPAQPAGTRALRGAKIQAYTLGHLKADPGLLRQIVGAYRRVFGAEPWNEWKVCTACGAKLSEAQYDADASNCCRSCAGGSLVDYHPPAKVVERLFAELAMPGSAPFLYVAQTPSPSGETQILGFTWGYGLPIADVIQHVVHQYFDDLPRDVAKRASDDMLQSLSAAWKSANTTYISELAVVDGARGSSMLFAQMLRATAQRQVELGYPTWILWTSRRSRAYPLAQLLGGVPLYSLERVVVGDDRLLLTGDSRDFLAVCDKYPADKITSYFIKAMRSMKSGIVAEKHESGKPRGISQSV